uniref:C2H2-type domain-containing protein n=1 Tax=Panagrolaimus sp. ES5 TaxID=591445 RepID=A0AC34FM14_9BILA
MKRLRELVGNLPIKDLFGAHNESQLILARAGLFPEGAQFKTSESLIICEAHLNELYNNFENSAHVLNRQNSRTRKQEKACSYADKHKDGKVVGTSRLLFEESRAIFHQKNNLVIQTGIPMCTAEKNDAENEWKKWKEAHPEKKFIRIPSDSFCDDDDDDKNDADYQPPSNLKKRDEKCDSLAHFAQLVGIQRATSNINLDKMTERTRSMKVTLAVKLFDKMAEVIAHDQKNDLKQDVCSKVLDINPHSPNDMEQLLRNMSQLYLEATDKTAKRHYLSYIVGIVPSSKISHYVPGISPYLYEKAIKYSQDNPTLKPEAPKREKFDAIKVENFIDFITSDAVVTGLPFGTRILKLSTTKLEIPSTLRLQKHGEIATMYAKFLEQQQKSYLLLPRSTMFHLLKVCSAKRTTAITCVDYFLSNAIDGMNLIVKVLDKWLSVGAVTQNNANILKHHLLESMQYLRTEFQINVSPTSVVASHCIKHSLSSATDSKFQTDDSDHAHEGFCDRCLKLVNTLEKIHDIAKTLKSDVEDNEIVDAAKKRDVDENLIATEAAIQSIKKLQQHFLRSIHSGNYRKDIIASLDANTALLTADWAQKYLIDYYKQTQSDYFARRGMAWHVSHCFTRVDGELAEHTFIDIIENAVQDSKTVLAILKHNLLKLKEQNINKIIVRSDNAGAYHSKEIIMSLKHIAEATGVKINHWSFSEPQSGKSSSDRKAATVKNALRAFIDKKNNIETESDFYKALTTPTALPHMTISRAKLEDTPIEPSGADATKTLTFPPIKQLFDFEVDDTFVKGRQANGIGSGFKIEFEKYKTFVQQQKLQIIETKTAEIFWNKVKSSAKVDTDDGMFTCPEEACSASFQNQQDLQSHLDIGIHDIPKENQADHAMIHFKKRLEEMIEDQTSLSRSNVVGAALSHFVGAESILTHFPRGWALADEKKSIKRFSEKQKKYMVQLFEQGLKNSKDMVRPEVAETMMKEANQLDGSPLFLATELLTKHQIKSFFGQLSKKNKLKTTKYDADVNELRKAIMEEAKKLSN